jgi:hypothetical protein
MLTAIVTVDHQNISAIKTHPLVRNIWGNDHWRPQILLQ